MGSYYYAGYSLRLDSYMYATVVNNNDHSDSFVLAVNRLCGDISYVHLHNLPFWACTCVHVHRHVTSVI